ncbi:NUDIX hydrolase [Corynebacterium halotolerans]|uniref:ADP-ribose pyrophosphatase n=1 Tax=Corynebacterium halotolerans YIM 70093 = DSM 44683 TaxID=1121362 RepID=M1NVS4_9CORY|nr:NUDIX domain-containing protein [Corynebacterium halotolerans]AGF71595.1 ADP-ribose pyrophosphatase [Corynebacterium halotolerans YIM 70093 = DSM 44683]
MHSPNRPGPLRDPLGVAKYRHEAVAVTLRIRFDDPAPPALEVLAYRRRRAPFEDRWALPSGAVEVEETLTESVLRHLGQRAGIAAPAHLEQLETRGAPGRDPWDRTIATAFLGLLPWSDGPRVRGELAWLPVADLPEMAFDHRELTQVGVERLRAKLSYTNIAFALAPASFTIARLRDAYAAVLGHEVSATNLKRILTRRGQLAETGQHAAPGTGGGRPAQLYRFTRRELTVTDPFAVLRP